MPSSRLQALLKHNNGFKLSEIDLQLRGPGVLYGVQQSGPLAIYLAGIQNPQDLQLALDLAAAFVQRREKIEDYPHLLAQINSYQQITHLN